MYINATHLEVISIFTATLQLESLDSGAYTIRKRGEIVEARFSNGAIVELIEVRQHDDYQTIVGYRVISYDSSCTVKDDTFYRLLDSRLYA